MFLIVFSHLNKSFTLRTGCAAIVKFYPKMNERKHSTKRWINFENTIKGNGYKVNFEYVKGIDNMLADYLSCEVSSTGKWINNMEKRDLTATCFPYISKEIGYSRNLSVTLLTIANNAL